MNLEGFLNGGVPEDPIEGLAGVLAFHDLKYLREVLPECPEVVSLLGPRDQPGELKPGPDLIRPRPDRWLDPSSLRIEMDPGLVLEVSAHRGVVLFMSAPRGPRRSGRRVESERDELVRWTVLETESLISVASPET